MFVLFQIKDGNVDFETQTTVMTKKAEMEVKVIQKIHIFDTFEIFFDIKYWYTRLNS